MKNENKIIIATIITIILGLILLTKPLIIGDYMEGYNTMVLLFLFEIIVNIWLLHWIFSKKAEDISDQEELFEILEDIKKDKKIIIKEIN